MYLWEKYWVPILVSPDPHARPSIKWYIKRLVPNLLYGSTEWWEGVPGVSLKIIYRIAIYNAPGYWTQAAYWEHVEHDWYTDIILNIILYISKCCMFLHSCLEYPSRWIYLYFLYNTGYTRWKIYSYKNPMLLFLF